MFSWAKKLFIKEIPLRPYVKFVFSKKATKIEEIFTVYSVVSIKRTGSLNYFEVFFHPVRSY